jgi:excisionase family DNA binding protein
MSKPTDPDVINAQEVARMLGVREHGIYDAAARREIPSRRIGRRVLFSRRQILAWLHGEHTPALPE